jgi:hypothetical protein|tara:strand:- start:24 stop:545 length:522 start_codon:yes stop_codon:yes gene_type:complete
MNDIEIIDNFLDFPNFKELQTKFLRPDMIWYYCDKVVGDSDYSQIHQMCDELDNYQMVHTMYNGYAPRSECFEWVIPIIFHPKIQCKSICRIKANLNLRTKERVVHGFHTDFTFECKTAIFYVNTNNGSTLFANGQEVESVENRMVLFNSQLEHTGTTSTDTKNRIVINFNYF